MTATRVSKLSPCTVVIVGDVILDAYFMGEVRRLSPEAPVPLVRVTHKSASLGGAGNVALNVAGLRCRPLLLGIRGGDAAGERLSALLKHHGLRDDLVVDASRSTTSKTRIIGQGQQLLRLDEEETHDGTAAVRGGLQARFEEMLGEADVVILSDYRKGVLDHELSAGIIDRCRSRGVPVFVDPRGENWNRYHGATCVTPNTGEVEAVAGCALGDDEALLVNTARSLRARYKLNWLLVTRGARGMCLVGPDERPCFIRATAREVYDVSGAGDTVIATCAVAAASGVALPEAAAVANVAAGIVVGKLGSQAIQLAELEAALKINGLGTRAVGMAKITAVDSAAVQIKAWQAAGEKVVYVNGSYDKLHPGNIHALQLAKELGDRLVVGLRSGASTRRLKGPKTPLLSQQDRAYVLSALECVDLIVSFREEETAPLVAILRPDIVVSGPTPGPAIVGGVEMIARAKGARVRIVPPRQGYEDL